MVSVSVNWIEAFNGIILITAILPESVRVKRRELLKVKGIKQAFYEMSNFYKLFGILINAGRFLKCKN